jgi:Zn-dependent membrane protease YugP
MRIIRMAGDATLAHGGPQMFGYFDPVWLLFAGPAMLLALWAQFRLKSAFARGSELRTRSNLSGAEAARMILDSNGLRSVQVERISTMLGDHYDPREKVLRLSPDVYDGRSVSSVGVAAHEAGHALQDAQHYAPLALRNGLVPLAISGSWISGVLLTIGFVLMMVSQTRGGLGLYFVYAGLVVFSVSVLMQLVNLPVEFDASRRAKVVLEQQGIVSSAEIGEVSAVLSAAAMTYVAATIGAVMQLLYYMYRAGLLGGERRN